MNGKQHWRVLGWGMGACVLLLLPWVAMQFTTEVRWSPGDFVFSALMLALAGGACEAVVRLSGHAAYRAAAALAILACFLMVWINAAVGVIGDEGNPANLVYLGVIVLALAGAWRLRWRAAGMVVASGGAAVALLLLGLVLLVLGRQEAAGATLGFAGLWALSAGLFRVAAR